MPGEDLTAPGFWGKLPTTGDFVARRLPAPFVRAWDRWVAWHLAPRCGAWPAGGLRFLIALPGLPSMTGVAVPSADRSGRAFPLTLAAPRDRLAAAAWYDALAVAGAEAAGGALDAAALDARLLTLLPEPAVWARPVAPLLLWTGTRAALAADPAAPGPALDALLAAPAEAD